MRYCAARGCSKSSAAAMHASLLFMDDLERIQAHRDLRGVEARKHGRSIYDRQRAKENFHRPVKPDGPAERLLIDHIDEDERQRKAQGQTGKIGQKSEQTRLNEYQLSNLTGGRAKKSKQAKLAPAVNHQSEKRSGYPHNRDDDRDRFQAVGDSKRAVKDADGFGAQVSIRKHKDAVAGGGLFNFDAHGFHLCSWRDVDRKIGGGGVYVAPGTQEKTVRVE